MGTSGHAVLFGVYIPRSNNGSIWSACLVLSEAARCIRMSAQHITIWQTTVTTLLLIQSSDCRDTYTHKQPHFLFSPRHYVDAWLGLYSGHMYVVKWHGIFFSLYELFPTWYVFFLLDFKMQRINFFWRVLPPGTSHCVVWQLQTIICHVRKREIASHRHMNPISATCPTGI